MNYFFLWFIKPLAELLGTIFMIVVVMLFIYVFFIITDKYRTYKIRKSKK